jgi:2-aminoadipate transaminase
MIKALKTHMPESVRWTNPQGGMFIWVTFDEAVDTDDLFELAVKHKVAFIPGSKFYPKENIKKNELRLNFSYADPELIEEGISRLANLL